MPGIPTFQLPLKVCVDKKILEILINQQGCAPFGSLCSNCNPPDILDCVYNNIRNVLGQVVFEYNSVWPNLLELSPVNEDCNPAVHLKVSYYYLNALLVEDTDNSWIWLYALADGGYLDQDGRPVPRTMYLNAAKPFIQGLPVSGRAPIRNQKQHTCDWDCVPLPSATIECISLQNTLLHELGHFLGVAHATACNNDPSQFTPGTLNALVMASPATTANRYANTMDCHLYCAIKLLHCPTTNVPISSTPCVGLVTLGVNGNMGNEYVFTAIDLLVYPNPTRSAISIEVPIWLSKGAVELFDELGRRIGNPVMLWNGKAVLNQESVLKPGMYYILLKTDDQIVSRKILIQY